jgi:hypothetical protein
LLERSTHIQLQDGSVVPLDEKSRKAILASLHELSTKALRCLGFAYKEDLGEFATYDGEFHPAHKLLLDPANYAAIETDLIFAGLAGLRVSLLFIVHMFCISTALHLTSQYWSRRCDNVLFCFVSYDVDKFLLWLL